MSGYAKQLFRSKEFLWLRESAQRHPMDITRSKFRKLRNGAFAATCKGVLRSGL